MYRFKICIDLPARETTRGGPGSWIPRKGERIMTGVRFLFRVTLRRLDLAAVIYHLREPQKCQAIAGLY
jgi:hypothetical protein